MSRTGGARDVPSTITTACRAAIAPVPRHLQPDTVHRSKPTVRPDLSLDIDRRRCAPIHGSGCSFGFRQRSGRPCRYRRTSDILRPACLRTSCIAPSPITSVYPIVRTSMPTSVSRTHSANIPCTRQGHRVRNETHKASLHRRHMPKRSRKHKAAAPRHPLLGSAASD